MDNKNDNLKIIICTLTNELKAISDEYAVYSKRLPTQTGFGFSAKASGKKELALAYYQYASNLAASVSKMETALSGLSQIILDADRNGSTDIVLLCDSILTRYGEFKKAISHFSTHNEQLLSGENVSPTDMIRLLSELGYKLNYFNSFLQEKL